MLCRASNSNMRHSIASENKNFSGNDTLNKPFLDSSNSFRMQSSTLPNSRVSLSDNQKNNNNMNSYQDPYNNQARKSDYESSNVHPQTFANPQSSMRPITENRQPFRDVNSSYSTDSWQRDKRDTHIDRQNTSAFPSSTNNTNFLSAHNQPQYEASNRNSINNYRNSYSGASDSKQHNVLNKPQDSFDIQTRHIEPSAYQRNSISRSRMSYDGFNKQPTNLNESQRSFATPQENSIKLQNPSPMVSI